MKQTVCKAYAFGGRDGGDFVIWRNECRSVCPLRFGLAEGNK